jgi:hypothetical protein
MGDNPKLKAFDFASDAVKQMIALATGITAVTISFAKDVLGGVSDAASTWFLPWQPQAILGVSWGLYLISVFVGIFTLMSMTGQLGQSDPDVNKVQIRYPAIAQSAAFVLATALIVIVGWAALGHH